jgi:hypothetical protein
MIVLLKRLLSINYVKALRSSHVQLELRIGLGLSHLIRHEPLNSPFKTSFVLIVLVLNSDFLTHKLISLSFLLFNS